MNITTPPLREQLAGLADVRPGDILDGGCIGVPRYERVSHLARSLGWLAKARRHLAIERGARTAHRACRDLSRRIRAIARQAGARGLHVVVLCPDGVSDAGSSHDAWSLYALLWLADSTGRIRVSLTLQSGFGSPTWAAGEFGSPGLSRGCWYIARRADVMLRRALGA